MLSGSKTMQNRSFSRLPSFFAPAETSNLDEAVAAPIALEILEFTFLHFHSVLELGVCARGRGVCVVEGVEYPFEAGDAQIVFPFQTHLSRSVGEPSMWYWLSLNPLKLLGQWGAPELSRLEQLLYARMGLCGIIDRGKYPLIAGLIQRIALPGERERRLSCLQTLIEELAAASEGLPPLKLRPERDFLRLEPAIRYAQEALEQGKLPAVTQMADACAMSVATFRRAFHQGLGQSPQAYVQACQMRMAQRLLLNTDESITQIALAVGYQDVSGFNRQFLRTFGVPPRRYRTAYRAER